MESQESKQLQNKLFLVSFLSKFGQKWSSHKHRAPSLSSIYSSPTSSKKLEKTNSPILGTIIPTKKQMEERTKVKL